MRQHAEEKTQAINVAYDAIRLYMKDAGPTPSTSRTENDYDPAGQPHEPPPTWDANNPSVTSNTSRWIKFGVVVLAVYVVFGIVGVRELPGSRC